MKVAIETQLPAFSNDLGDVVRLFFGEGAADPEGPGRVIHRHTEECGRWHEEMILLLPDCPDMQRTAEMDSPPEALEQKRLLKRLLKRTLYEMLKEATGFTFPWGSLTGIRPLRLYRQQMEAGMTREEASRVMRDLFDVSPEKISLLEELEEVQRPYLNSGQKCDLYVGIPFCRTRCSYCSFSSGEIGDGHLTEPYTQALIREIEETARLVRDRGLTLGCAYVGGGTPTSLSVQELQRILCAIQKLGPFEEWTVEAGRPDTLNREKLSMLQEFPVTRISINPQTMHDETLERIGRRHTARDTEECYAMARSMGFQDINMDIIAALPGETLAMFEETLARIEEMNPDSLTVHTLAVKRSSRLHEKGYRPETEQEAAQMVLRGREAAHRLGMRAYYLYRQKYMAAALENVGYARTGKICRYNIDNMEETASVLALGAGGISKRILGRDRRILRAPNVSNIEEYIRRVPEMCDRRHAIFEEGGDKA